MVNYLQKLTCGEFLFTFWALKEYKLTQKEAKTLRKSQKSPKRACYFGRKVLIIVYSRLLDCILHVIIPIFRIKRFPSSVIVKNTYLGNLSLWLFNNLHFNSFSFLGRKFNLRHSGWLFVKE